MSENPNERPEQSGAADAASGAAENDNPLGKYGIGDSNYGLSSDFSWNSSADSGYRTGDESTPGSDPSFAATNNAAPSIGFTDGTTSMTDPVTGYQTTASAPSFGGTSDPYAGTPAAPAYAAAPAPAPQQQYIAAPAAPQYGAPGYGAPPQVPGGYPNPYFAPQQPKPSNATGIVALVLGILAILFAFIPFAGAFLGGVLAIIAIIMGIVALVSKTTLKKGIALTGLILGALALLISILNPIVMIGIINAEINRTDGTASVELRIQGTEPPYISASMYNSLYGNEHYFSEYETFTPTSNSWSQTYDIAYRSDTDVYISVFATVDSFEPNASVKCEIYIDGKLVDSDTGDYMADCTFDGTIG